MNATKRKFNSLLNGLGTKSNSSLNTDSTLETATNNTAILSSDSLVEQARKRRALRTSAALTEVSQYPPQISSLSSGDVRHAKSKAQIPGSNVEKLKYAPWDRAAFLERLRSFSSLTDWTPKPAKVNEVEWAKRGWVCQRFERVRCCLCNIEILVKLNTKEVNGKEQPVYVASQIEDALVDKYAEMIVTSHAEDCLWRQRGCDDSIFRLSLNQSTPTLRALRDRYDGLCTQAGQLPYMHNLKTPESFDLDTTLAYLPEDFFSTSSNPTTTASAPQRLDINRVAMTMALFGWKSKREHMSKYGASQCESCFRNLGLWLFKSKEVNDAGDMVRPPSMNCCNLELEHRDYCPWRNAHSQSGNAVDALAAWEVLLRVLKNDQFLKRGRVSTPTKTAIRVAASNEHIVGLKTTVEDRIDNEDAAKQQEEQDKQRWARLKRVKSMFDSKGSKRKSMASMVGKEQTN